MPFDQLAKSMVTSLSSLFQHDQIKANENVRITHFLVHANDRSGSALVFITGPTEEIKKTYMIRLGREPFPRASLTIQTPCRLSFDGFHQTNHFPSDEDSISTIPLPECTINPYTPAARGLGYSLQYSIKILPVSKVSYDKILVFSY